MKKILILLILLIACTPRLYEIKETQQIMGTFVSITVHHEDKTQASDAVQRAYDEIRRIDELLSTYKENSDISILNQNKRIIEPSEDLIVNIEKANYYSELSDGSFDISVKPILDLYTYTFSEENRPPTEDEVKRELEKVGYSRIIIDENEISIGEGQKITLGGIAKGYAVDKAIEVLLENGIKNALVNAGGDMRAVGKKYGSIEWSIALANPRDGEEFITLVPISDKAIVTSGDYERYYDENKEFHHIVNPLTGYSATELISVTIIADNAFDADAISTAVFVLGKEKGLELVEQLGVDAVIITKDREISNTFALES